MEQELTVESELLHAILKGDFSLHDAQHAFAELVDSAARHQSTKVLLDGRGICGDPATIERFFQGSFAAEEVCKLGRYIAFAYVLLPPILDRERFGETVAANRGMKVKTFRDPDEALEWLGVDPARKPV